MPARAVAFLSMLCVAAGLAASASAFDRPPISINGLVSDGWGQSTTSAEQNLVARYPTIRRPFCLGIKMKGYPASSSSWVHGTTRYWDKLVCFARSWRGTVFGLIYDQKSPRSWTIYRLSGIGVAELHGQ
jgi:hypothetical protein